MIVAVAAGIGLAAFFHGSHLGLQTRAVVGDPELTELVGTSARRVTTISWMLGCSFATVSGILFAPFIQLDSLLLTLLVVQAFGAAVVGRLRSLPLTNLGAYAIGIGAALSTKLVAHRPALAGLPTSLPFIVLFIVLVASRKGTFAEMTRTAPGGPAVAPSPSGSSPGWVWSPSSSRRSSTGRASSPPPPPSPSSSSSPAFPCSSDCHVRSRSATPCSSSSVPRRSRTCCRREFRTSWPSRWRHS